MEDVQFKARDFWVEIEGRTHPTTFAKFSRNTVGNARPAPTMADAQAHQATPAPAKPAAQAKSGARQQPFTGLKVADFAWVGVGPIISKYLL